MKKHTVWIGLLACLWAGQVGAQSFVKIVAADGSGNYKTLQEAVDACPEDGRRHIIFIKKGVYEERVNLPKNKQISLVGESRDKVVVTNDRNRGKGSLYKNFRDITTMQCYGDDFYMENITVANTAGNVGQAEAHFIAGKRQVYKNCKFTGYQDTQRTKGGSSAYLQNCRIEGAVDFIYGEGTVYYDRCVVNSVQGGGYLTAPAECLVSEMGSDGKLLHYGYVFRNCHLIADKGVQPGSYYLGRPWKKTAASYFIDCHLGDHINAKGWNEWNGNETTADFAEFGSTNHSGLPVDVSKRVAWSRQLKKEDVYRFTPHYIFEKLKDGKGFDPIAMCRPIMAPNNVKKNSEEIVWNKVDGAVGYLVFCDGDFVAAVDDTSYKTGTEKGHFYTVKSVSSIGATSIEAKALTAGEMTLKAFPTAEGFGKYASGGRGGKVVTVTNLKDDAKGETEGSLRWALNQYPSDFTVVFAVSGTIDLVAPLRCNKKNYTIAGQTAPGDGICISKNKVNLGGSQNFIIRHVRFRVGNTDVNGKHISANALGAENCTNFIIDHCSFSWSAEENMNTFDDHFHTVQWCIVSEGLYKAGHAKGVRSYASQWGGSSATYHHNLLANNSSRSCRFNGARGRAVGQDLSVFIEYINNVNYNWGRVNSCYGAENSSEHTDYYGYESNFVNNYYKPGPSTPSAPHFFFEQSMARKGAVSRGPSRWYISGNVMEGDNTVTADNWKGVRAGKGMTYTVKEMKSKKIIVPSGRHDAEKYWYDWNKYTYKDFQTAYEAYEAVLNGAGAFPRDRIDERLVDDVRRGSFTYGNKGIINLPTDAEGFQVYKTYNEYIDKDGDGMDDEWERLNGLDPNNPDDRNRLTKCGYTALEVYLNSLVGENIPHDF